MVTPLETSRGPGHVGLGDDVSETVTIESQQ